MRLLEVNGHNFNAPQAGELLDILKRDCESWLSASKWLPVYRGSKMISSYDDFVKIKTRPDKQDPDIPSTIQQTFDYALEQNGHTALIKNSVHVIGNLQEVETYGRVFVIFPIGTFSFTWSPEVASLMGALYKSGEKIKELKEILPTYRDDGLSEAIRSGKEILVKCTEYYKVDVDLWNQISS